jgi:hypothetical protein
VAHSTTLISYFTHGINAVSLYRGLCFFSCYGLEAEDQFARSLPFNNFYIFEGLLSLHVSYFSGGINIFICETQRLFTADESLIGQAQRLRKTCAIYQYPGK